MVNGDAGGIGNNSDAVLGAVPSRNFSLLDLGKRHLTCEDRCSTELTPVSHRSWSNCLYCSISRFDQLQLYNGNEEEDVPITLRQPELSNAYCSGSICRCFHRAAFVATNHVVFLRRCITATTFAISCYYPFKIKWFLGSNRLTVDTVGYGQDLSMRRAERRGELVLCLITAPRLG